MSQRDGAAGVFPAPDIAIGHQHRFNRVQVFSILGAHQGQIQLSQGFHNRVQLCGMLAHLRRQRRQDAAFFVALGQLQLMPAVVQFHHHQRLHKQGLPGGGLVVDDGAQPPLEVCAQRDHIAPVALGDDLLLQDRLILGVVDHPLQPAEQPLVRHFEF